jgi:intein/homing endonuclease
VFEVELEDGTTIELTEDHQVLTQNGYKQVKELTEEDFLYSVV